MRRGIIAAGLASAIALPGCGSQEAPSSVQSDVKTAVAANTYAGSKYNLSGITTSKLQDLAKFTFKVAGVKHEVSSYYENEKSRPAKESAILYTNIQSSLLKLIQRFSSINLSMHSTSGQTELVTSQMYSINRPVVLIETSNGKFSTPNHKKYNDIEPAFTVQDPAGLSESMPVSFIENTNTKPYNTNIGTEACNAAIAVDTKGTALGSTPQEVVCNSMGVAYELAQLGYSYSTYSNEVARSLTWYVPGVGSMPDIKLPQASYVQIMRAEVPSVL
jgi:hypothetical protein